MILDYIKKLWEFLNKISPTNRNLIIILLMGYIFYSQINTSTKEFIHEKITYDLQTEKNAEQYTKDTALELNRQVRLIMEKDQDACNVLLLSYHNSKQSLQGFKYLYLSCLTEAPRSLDTPLLRQQWNNIDYVYYADELTRIHTQSFVQIKDVEDMKDILPKLYHLVKTSDAKAISFFTIEGKDFPIGMVVVFYKDTPSSKSNYTRAILPSIQRLAILLDYENIQK